MPTKKSRWTPELITAIIVAVFGTGGFATLFANKGSDYDEVNKKLEENTKTLQDMQDQIEKLSTTNQQLAGKNDQCAKMKLAVRDQVEKMLQASQVTGPVNVTGSTGVAIGGSTVTMGSSAKEIQALLDSVDVEPETEK